MTTTLITGAGRGIGLALCRLLAAHGHSVIAACRAPTAELLALGVRIEAGVDVGERKTLTALRERLGDTRIDWLIANAGILAHESLPSPESPDALDVDSITEQFRVNALGSLLTVSELSPRLGQGSKVALITSRMGSIGDNTSGGYYGYRMSKAALNAAGVSLAHDLRPRGISVAILHPGFVRTQMTGGTGQLEAADSARLLIARIEALDLASSGTFWHANGDRLPW